MGEFSRLGVFHIPVARLTFSLLILATGVVGLIAGVGMLHLICISPWSAQIEPCIWRIADFLVRLFPTFYRPYYSYDRRLRYRFDRCLQPGAIDNIQRNIRRIARALFHSFMSRFLPPRMEDRLCEGLDGIAVRYARQTRDAQTTRFHMALIACSLLPLDFDQDKRIRRDDEMVAWDRVTDADARRAIKESDRLGRERFFAEHGFAPTTTYELIWEERRCPPKAILGTAYEFATGQRLACGDFEGGSTGAVSCSDGWDSPSRKSDDQPGKVGAPMLSSPTRRTTSRSPSTQRPASDRSGRPDR